MEILNHDTTTSEDVLDVLRSTTLFAGFTEEQLEMVPKVAQLCSYETGEKIIEVDSAEPASMFLILEGTADVCIADETINSLGSGDHLGEMALLVEDAVRSADVVATTPTRALQLKRSHLRGLVSSTPEIAMGMLSELARRLHRTTRQLRQVAEASPEGQRLVREVESEQRRRKVGRLDPIEYTLSATHNG